MGKSNYNQFNKIRLCCVDVILNKKHLPKETYLIDNTKRVYEEDGFKIQLDISNYLQGGIEYVVDTFPFIDTRYAGLICHEYLYERHQLYTTTEQENAKQSRVAKPFEIFPMKVYSNVEFFYDSNELKFHDIAFERKILDHIRQMENAFTMFNVITNGTSSVAVFVQRYQNVLHVYVADHRNKRYKDVDMLCKKLKSYYIANLSANCICHYIVNNVNLKLNEKEHNFDVMGCCILISHLLMDFLYMNMIVYQNIRYDSAPGHLASYISVMINYFYNNFYIGDIWKHLLSNYALRIFDKTGFFHDNEKSRVPPYFKLINLKDIRSHQNVTFREQFDNFILKHRLYRNIVGINWQYQPNSIDLPQKHNNFHYFYPEDLRMMPNKFFTFTSMMSKHSIFNIENNYRSVHYKTNHGHSFYQPNKIDYITFLFINMEGFLNYMIKKRMKIKLNYENANLYAIIEHINTQLDHLRIPKTYDTYINAEMLYNIAIQVIQIKNIMLTPLMVYIFINLLNKQELHIMFWNNLQNIMNDMNSDMHKEIVKELGISMNYANNFSSPRIQYIKETVLIRDYITKNFPLQYKYTMMDIFNDDTFIGYWVDPNENTNGILAEKLHHVIENANTSHSTLSGIILKKQIFYFNRTKYNDRLTLMIRRER